MTVAWAIGTTMLVVCGSTMHATQASSNAMRQEYPTAYRPVKGTDVHVVPAGVIQTCDAWRIVRIDAAAHRPRLY